jgi:hypothetical protein
VAVPESVRLDGVSLWPLLGGEAGSWPDRHITIQSHRGDVPQRYHHFMTRNQRYKLVHPSGFGREGFEGEPAFELYDMQQDPLELEDLASEKTEVVEQMRATYDQWFDDVSHTRPDNYDPPRIVVGSPHESLTVLTRQDWRHTKGRPWAPDSNGHWELDLAMPGEYDVRMRFPPLEAPGSAMLHLGDETRSVTVPALAEGAAFEGVPLAAGPLRLQVTLVRGQDDRGPWQVDLSRGPAAPEGP